MIRCASVIQSKAMHLSFKKTMMKWSWFHRWHASVIQTKQSHGSSLEQEYELTLAAETPIASWEHAGERSTLRLLGNILLLVWWWRGCAIGVRSVVSTYQPAHSHNFGVTVRSINKINIDGGLKIALRIANWYLCEFHTKAYIFLIEFTLNLI